MTKIFDWIKDYITGVWRGLNNVFKSIITIIGVLAALAAIFTFILQFPALWRDFQKKDTVRKTKKVVELSPCHAVYKDSTNHKIVILPFFKNCETGRDVGLEILNRFEKLKVNDSLKLDLCYLYNFKPEPNFTKEQADEVRKKNHADQIIYGINSSINCSSQDTLLEVCVKSITGLKELNNQIVSVDLVVASLSQIRHGFLQTDIDNTVYISNLVRDEIDGRYEQSLKRLDKVKHVPRNAFHYSIKASLFNKLNKKDSALANYNNAVRLEPIATNYYDRGVFYRTRIKKYDAALSDFVKAYEITKDVSQAHGILFELCLTLHSIGEYDQSTYWANNYISFIKKHKEKSLYNKHDLAIIYEFKGKNLLFTGKDSQAIACLDTSLSLNPSELNVLRMKADLLAVEFKFSEALKLYNDIIKKDSSDYRFYAGRGEIHDRLGNDSLSKKDFTKALEKGKHSAATYQLLGVKMRKLGRNWLSFRMLLKARDIDKGDATIYFQLAITYEELNLMKDAIKYYNKSLSMDLDPLYLYSLAFAYYKVGDYKNAIDYFSTYIKLYKQSAYRAYYYRALCKLVTNDKTGMEDMNKAKSMGMTLAKDYSEMRDNKLYFK